MLGVQNGVLIDQYARADITQLAKGNAYNRLQWEEMTVGQALALAQIGSPSWPASQPGMPPQVSTFLNMIDPAECVTLSCQKSEAHPILYGLTYLTVSCGCSRGRAMRAALHDRRESLSALRMTISGKAMPCSRHSV